jgi:hypothetical protein
MYVNIHTRANFISLEQQQADGKSDVGPKTWSFVIQKILNSKHFQALKSKI